MGHEQSKSKKTINTKHMDNNKLNVILKQIYFTAQLYKDRRKGQQNMREKELLNLFREPANRRVKDNEYQKAAAIVNDIKWIKAFEYVMRYADLLKDNETVIQMSKGNTANISELIPYVESLIWGCQKGNIDCIKAFQDYICLAFGPETYNQLCTFTRVTPELKECFANVLPTEKEVKLYLIDFCNRNGVTLESMNEIGHSLSLSALADFPDSNTQFQAPPLDTQTQQTQTSGYPNYPGNFQQGYPQPPNNFPGQGGNFPQSGFPQGGFPQGGDGSQHGSGFPQGGYPQGGNGSQQGGFPQGGFPQGGDGSQHGSGFPQGGYPQGGFPQDSNQQGGFPQKGMSLGGSYAQRGVQYPQFSDYPPSNFNANPLEPYKQAPLGGIQGPSGNSNLNMEVREMSFGQQGQPEQPGSGMGGFPNFQKFGGPGGQMGSGDPLDELDQRLRNIKGGL